MAKKRSPATATAPSTNGEPAWKRTKGEKCSDGWKSL
ncbi:hypothetical protein TrRE_jg13003, partial [Triparma retinervis]